MAACRRLLEELVVRLSQEHREPIMPDTPVAVLAEAWFAELAARDRSSSTISQYRYRLDRQILPALGHLPTSKLTVARVDRHLQAVAAVHGPALARMVRSVLSGMCGLAARHDALARNPVRDTGPIPITRRGRPTVLTADEAVRLVATLDADPIARRRDLPDLIRILLATGMRIGEGAALAWDTVDLDAGTVTVRGTVVRVRGRGLVITSQPKTFAGFRTLLLPPWAIAMLRYRLAHRASGGAAAAGLGRRPVFPAPVSGGLRDPSNTAAHLHVALEAAGRGELSSHVCRRTVATLMHEAGLPSDAIADQLGHRHSTITRSSYVVTSAVHSGAAEVLAALKLWEVEP